MSRSPFHIFVLLLAVCTASAGTLLPVPFVSDPPPELDGSAARMSRLANWRELAAADDVVFGRQLWQGPQDLSASVKFGWDRNHFYFAAKVVDDAPSPPRFGRDLWRGDHIVILLSYPADAEPGTETLLQIEFAPGDGGDLAPEAWIRRPAGVSPEKLRIGGRRSADGYTLEGAIPWTMLLDLPAARGVKFRLGCFVSDADGDTQEKVLSLAGAPFKIMHDPARLLPAVLTDSDETVEAAWREPEKTVELLAERLVPCQGGIECPLPDDRTAGVRDLIVLARVDRPKFGGGSPAVRLALNGTVLDGDRLRERPPTMLYRGLEINVYRANQQSFFLPIGPGFDFRKLPTPFTDRDGRPCNAMELRLHVADLLKESGNVLTIANTYRAELPLAVAVAGSSRQAPVRREKPLAPAPTGAIPTFEPETPPTEPRYGAQLLPGGGVAVTLNGRTFELQSAYSTRAPGIWRHLDRPARPGCRTDGATATVKEQDFTLRRELRTTPSCLRILDTVTNTSGELIPLMNRHRIAIDGTADFYVGGYRKASAKMELACGENPTAAAVFPDRVIALVAEDDVSRAQGTFGAEAAAIFLDNWQLVLPPGQSITLEYSVYPVEKGDRYALVNRIRRDWQVNFTIPGSLCIFSPSQYKVPQDLITDFVRRKSAKLVISAGPYSHGTMHHGNAWFGLDQSFYRELYRKIRTADPETKIFAYYHCYISNGDGDAARFEENQLYSAPGVHATYSNPGSFMFLPAGDDDYTRLQKRMVDFLYDELGADGVFWDEIDYSRYKIDYNPAFWDGHSARIDRQSHRIVRKISNITLLTRDWRAGMVKYLLSRGPLLGNGAPLTRTFTQFHFPRTIETGSISALVNGELYTPVALGDHLTEKTELDCYRNMVRGLDYGALYYWYTKTVRPTHATLTEQMFPATPVALGHGFLIAEERILTNRSGFFGWGDASGFTATVYDRAGRRTDETPIPRVERDGKVYAEVRIPEGFSVALIRQR